MGFDADLRAFDALGAHDRLADIAAMTWSVMAAAIDGDSPEARAKAAAEQAAALGLTREQATTPFGNVLDLLERGPEDAAERTLARALAGRALAARPPSRSEDSDRAAGDLVWLAARTPFDATGLIDRALDGPQASAMWDAMAERVRRADQGTLPTLGSAEGLVAAVALACSDSETAAGRIRALAAEVREPKLAYVLGQARARIAPSAVIGEVAPRPRGPFFTAILGLTGISALLHIARWVGRWLLAYRKPAQVTLSGDGGVHVKWRTELLGRTLRDHEIFLSRGEIARASRELRYPALGLYTGLMALAVGSYVGMSTLIDGVRAESPSVIATGLAVMALGLGADFALSSLIPGSRGRCRMVVAPRRGAPLCVGMDIASADALLARLSAG
jgi:hypothetical protein